MADSELTILHVDMDAFYASIEQRDRPELRGKPVIVGGSAEGRGVVCAASYEARTFGVHSAMPAVTARRLCPDGVFLPIRMDHYARIARQIREILFSFTPVVEPLSLDEAYLDIRGCESACRPPGHVAQRIKDRVRAETDLTASVGVAPNKFLAKLASDCSKPDGLLVIEPAKVMAFLDALPVGRLWGVGRRSEQRLHALAVTTIGDLSRLPEHVVVDHLGESGRAFWHMAHGRDDRPVLSDREAKSISSETTFAEDIGDRAVLRAWLQELVEQLGQRLRQAEVQARTVDVKFRTADFRTFFRAQRLAAPSDLTAVLWETAAAIFDRCIVERQLPLRLLGVGASNLVRESSVQGDLFDQAWREKQKSLDQTLDQIRGRYGRGAIRRGGRLDWD